MPKVELHVHLEGAIRPETLLDLARRNGVSLPYDTVEGLRAWYAFTDFPHFAEIYQTISRCLCTADDLERMTRDFLIGQAQQNILHTEATYTALTHWRNTGIPFAEQLAAINRARDWAAQELGVSLLLIVDIPREFATVEEGLWTADAAISGMGNGVAALGLGGYEVGFPPEMFQAAFDRAHAAGVPAVIHAGETGGPESIRGAIDALHAVRIGHGVRCVDDPTLVAELRDRQIPLEVNPSSNVCLKVVPDLASHPLPYLMAEGLYVTVNSDDPPMFDTTLTEEYRRCSEAFGWDQAQLKKLVLAAAKVSLLPDAEKKALVERCTG